MNAEHKNNGSVRVRFAPSPTGHLHIGSLRTALFNYLFARHNNGIYLVRIEDTDTQRSKPEYTRSIFASLKWLDLQPDEPIVVQSNRIDEHKKIIADLVESRKAYRCYCSPDQVMVRHQEKHPGDPFVKYDGLCREKKLNENGDYVIRFALPKDRHEIIFDDLIRGRVTVTRDQLDDFIIARSDGRPMYNFVVVVDDAFMEITHVIRGEDHISNTPKQLLLYEACGYNVPQFAHLPLILGPSGDRLSKRDAATSVLEYTQEGYLPNALINYLVRLGWSHGDQELFTREQLIEYFALKDVGKKGAIFDLNKLQWVNSMYIKETSAQDLYAYILEYIKTDFKEKLARWDEQRIFDAIDAYKQRVHTLKELVDVIMHLYVGPHTFDEQAIKKWVDSETKKYVHELYIVLEQQEPFVSDQLSSAIKNMTKQLGIKFVAIAQPIRIALIGHDSGPGVFALLTILGKKESLRRIKTLHDTIA